MLLQLGTHYLTENILQDINAIKPEAYTKLNSLKEKNCVDAQNTGWWNWPEESGFQDLRHIREVLLNLDIAYDIVVVIGIGGSYAGTKALSEAMRHQFADQLVNEDRYVPVVYLGNNLSERAFLEVLELLEQREPIVNVISKSGNTLEPNIAFRVLEEVLIKRFGKEAQKRIFVSTQTEKSSLFELAQFRNYRVFPIPSNVGGRYSVLTTVGLLPLSLAGYDTEQLLAGADRLFEELRGDVSKDHPVLTYAAFRKYAWNEGKALEVLSYREPKLASLIEWWKQLFAESEGKEGKGLMPMGMGYTTDLHSLGQYLQEGPSNMIETFLNIGPAKSLVEKRLKIPVDEIGANKHLNSLYGRYVNDIDYAAWEASQKAHSQRGVPCLEMKVSHLDEYHLGYLFAFFECACAISALLLDVNPFDQPGVEVYKRELMNLVG